MGRSRRTPQFRYEPWVEQAACAHDNPEIFFHDNDVIHAKRICNDCPVILQCRLAHEKEPFGVFGGLTAAERGYTRGRVEARFRQ